MSREKEKKKGGNNEIVSCFFPLARAGMTSSLLPVHQIVCHSSFFRRRRCLLVRERMSPSIALIVSPLAISGHFRCDDIIKDLFLKSLSTPPHACFYHFLFFLFEQHSAKYFNFYFIWVFIARKVFETSMSIRWKEFVYLLIVFLFFYPGDKDSFERDVYHCAALRV